MGAVAATAMAATDSTATVTAATVTTEASTKAVATVETGTKAAAMVTCETKATSMAATDTKGTGIARSMKPATDTVATATDAPGAAHCTHYNYAPPSSPRSPDHSTKDMYLMDMDEHVNLTQGYNSDSELSQKLLVEEIKQLVEKSVERRVKRRTSKKRKRKESNIYDRVDGSEEDTRAYSRCSIPYVHTVIKSINCSEHRKQLVKEMGFEHMLQLDDANVPRLFAQWIADHTVPNEEAIKIGDKTIPISPKSFQDILGIPAGDIPVESDEMAGKAEFLQLFGLSEVPSIRYFGDKIIMEQDLPDDVFCRCAMSVFLGAFICPNSSTRPNTKYMGALIVVDRIKHFNWAKFAYDWFIYYVRKYLKEKGKQTKETVTLGGCIYHLAVRYLDFVEFGSIKLPSTIPRICVWKGKLIKHFSEMDKGKDGNYGNNTIKELCETCYGNSATFVSQMAGNHIFLKNEIDRVVGEHMTKKVKDGIYDSFQSHMIHADRESYLNAQNLVLDFLKIITGEGVSKPSSETTDLIETHDSTQETDVQQHTDSIQRKRRSHTHAEISSHCFTEERINLESNESLHGNEGDLIQRKRRCLRHTEDIMCCKISDKAINNVESHLSKDPQVGMNSPDMKRASTMSRWKSISLNHTPSDDDGQNSTPEKEIEQEKGNGFSETHLDEGQKIEKEIGTLNANIETTNKVLTVQTIACIAEEHASLDNMPDVHMSREEYLKEARKKYYFKDRTLPSFRLFEFFDDNDNFIEEKELWRPVGTYRKMSKLMIIMKGRSH